MNISIRHAGFALLLALGAGSSALAADEVHWRYDYTAARRESAQTARPMFLDFSTEWCMPCKRLEQTTFRDPAVVKLLNEQFIPVKLDGSKEKILLDLLHVQVFPTLILAGPDGRIVRSIEGYVEAGRLLEQLQEIAGVSVSPDWMIRARDDARKAVLAGDYARALILLQSILRDGQSRPVQQEARKLIAEIDQQARTRLAQAKAIDERGQALEAANELTRVMQTFPGTETAGEAAKLLANLAEKPELKVQQRRQRAAELLAQAKNDYRAQQHLCCLDRCVVLVQGYSDLPEAGEAAQILEQIKTNPEWMKTAADRLSERLAEMQLALAESWMSKGDAQRAAECLEKVSVLVPGSRYAEYAKTRLSQIRGRAVSAAGPSK
jgi:thioredoxin-related protein